MRDLIIRRLRTGRLQSRAPRLLPAEAPVRRTRSRQARALSTSTRSSARSTSSRRARRPLRRLTASLPATSLSAARRSSASPALRHRRRFRRSRLSLPGAGLRSSPRERSREGWTRDAQAHHICAVPPYHPSLIGERGEDTGQPVEFRVEGTLLPCDLVEREDHAPA